MANEWLELRCTRPGFLPDDLPVQPPEGSTRFDGVLNVVIDPEERGVRRIPMIYLGPSPVFAAPRAERLKPQLARAVEIIRAVPDTPTYALTRVTLDGHEGIYARDMSVRDVFRMYLRRLGMTFADEPFLFLSPEGFATSTGALVDHSFIVLGHYDEEEPEKVVHTSGAFVPFTLAQFRLGGVTPAELKRLTALARGRPVLSSASPNTLVDALRAELGG